MMIVPAFLKDTKDRILSANIVYFLFPVILIIGLYFTFLPFNQTYIGDWHDIFANSFYYTLVEKNYFVTWNDLGNGGFPLTASPGADKYYIFSFPFYLVFQSLSIVNYIMLLHLLIAYFAFYKFGSLLTKNDNALLIFSLFFAFSGMMMGRISVGHHLLLYGLAWIPLLYYFFFKITLFDEPLMKNALGLSVVAALIYFTGNIYHFVFAFFIIFIFFTYFAISGRISKQVLCILGVSLFLVLLLISIKGIPDLGASSLIERIDPIDPLTGGGSLENDLASFVSGIGIDTVWTQAESGIMIGIIPLIFAILALLYGRKEITVPSFLVILFSCIWAAGGKTVLSFIHLLPLINTLRNPGRIFGSTLPIILFLALYGVVIFYQKYKEDSSFLLSQDQKRLLSYGIVLLCFEKLLELPFQEMISFETILVFLLIAGFVAVLFFNKGSVRNILIYSGISAIVNFLLIYTAYTLPKKQLVMQISVILVLFLLLYLFIYKFRQSAKYPEYLCAILLAGIILMMIANLGSGYITVVDPEFEKSPAPEIIERIRSIPTENSQIWICNSGWPNKHIDFTYWYIANNIHSVNYYTAYYLKDFTPMMLEVGGIQYYFPDYFVDTGYLDNGNQNIDGYTFKVQNISVKKNANVLPTVFLIRNHHLVALKVENYSPDNIIATGQMSPDDIVVLKNSYYPGWKANGMDTTPYGYMVSIRLTEPAEKISFVFDPLDYKIGAILSGFGCIMLIILLAKRKVVDQFIDKNIGSTSSVKEKKAKKRVR
jgi:hypothetical protein